ncbi:hypothetical protein [Streptomyces europaeiscabiei]|uniref:hypothetical protein n=1 Tax=Streptomyces europaeiscabiei TaxID=146819 RepID=UPI002E10E532|nr:hypothetical protein OHB30_48725 [Streptomyces europaeiscabiei]
MQSDRPVFADTSRWADLSAAELVRAAVAETAGIFRHEEFLRPSPCSLRRIRSRRQGSRYSHELGDGFADVVLKAAEAINSVRRLLSGLSVTAVSGADTALPWP